ncbi:hypothetical protein [Modestobacter roseus]|uniref:NAD-dependent epimerase/dehydratase family protein n=1 Tax=Modestobacter roseus TaxID=1181884 RepID=A0A562IQM4_9ACTN|nr:hypothetical protein [Modestobacter roseus]MQA35690.1 hypothetical protein [Modestobacter roseus]TWH72894.1 hypothetical protein JD78_01417 [Modestobacter roseus]
MTTLDDLVAAAEAGRSAWIDGGRHVVDVIHVDDLADAIALTLTRGEPGGTYYVTDGAPCRSACSSRRCWPTAESI